MSEVRDIMDRAEVDTTNSGNIRINSRGRTAENRIKIELVIEIGIAAGLREAIDLISKVMGSSLEQDLNSDVMRSRIVDCHE